jgi:hypothetical protein
VELRVHAKTGAAEGAGAATAGHLTVIATRTFTGTSTGTFTGTCEETSGARPPRSGRAWWCAGTFGTF